MTARVTLPSPRRRRRHRHPRPDRWSDWLPGRPVPPPRLHRILRFRLHSRRSPRCRPSRLAPRPPCHRANVAPLTVRVPALWTAPPRPAPPTPPAPPFPPATRSTVRYRRHRPPHPGTRPAIPGCPLLRRQPPRRPPLAAGSSCAARTAPTAGAAHRVVTLESVVGQSHVPGVVNRSPPHAPPAPPMPPAPPALPAPAVASRPARPADRAIDRRSRALGLPIHRCRRSHRCRPPRRAARAAGTADGPVRIELVVGELSGPGVDQDGAALGQAAGGARGAR